MFCYRRNGCLAVLEIPGAFSHKMLNLCFLCVEILCFAIGVMVTYLLRGTFLICVDGLVAYTNGNYRSQQYSSVF